jgi:hypothetical protein
MKFAYNIWFLFLHVCVCWCYCAFCNKFGNNDISQEIYMSTNHSIFSFVCTPYISAFFIHKNPWSCERSWFWNLVTKYIYIPKKLMILCDKFAKQDVYDRNILHMWQGKFISILIYEHIRDLFILFGRFNL